MQVMMGIVGVTVLLLIAVVFSSNRKAISLRTVGGALLLQALVPAFVLLTASGAGILKQISAGVQSVIDSADAGISFLFGPLVSDKMFEVFAGNGFVFALKVLPVIIFFAALMSVIYHLNIMQWIIRYSAEDCIRCSVQAGQSQCPLLPTSLWARRKRLWWSNPISLSWRVPNSSPSCPEAWLP